MVSAAPGSGKMQPQRGQKEGSATEKGDAATIGRFFLLGLRTADIFSAHAYRTGVKRSPRQKC